MREVDQLQDAVDERVAEGDQRIDRARRDPDQQNREEVARRLDQVDDEPRDDQRDEDPTEDGRDGEAPGSDEPCEPRLLLGAG
ncbi:MAG TPA: hypothetical protein VFU26_05850 [Gaiellaceae bacterium]|nr:hypothetical protein [Gaiellaceae bacterium]